MRILAPLVSRFEGLVVSRQTVAEDGGRPHRERESHPLAVAQEPLGRHRDGSPELVLATTERCDREHPVRRDDLTASRLGELVRLFEE